MVGLTIAHLGVTLFLLSELGSDPFNVLIQGLFRTLSRYVHSPLLTHGRVHIAVCLLIILVLLIVDRSYVKIGTVLCLLQYAACAAEYLPALDGRPDPGSGPWLFHPCLWNDDRHQV